MNPSTALARALLDELVRGGVREAVLCPGSRSAPLAYALHDAEAAGRLRLHVRIDERSGGFLALGLAKASGTPVVVVTTSGTATANLHPAVLEAAHSGVPVVVLTADRPPELRGTGANQTIDQVDLYGSAVRLFAEVGTPGRRAGDNAYWRSLACRALAAAQGELGRATGPVHLNVGLREPLTPEATGDWVEPLDGREGGLPWTAREAAAPATPSPSDDLPDRTLVVLGDGPPGPARAALRLAETRGFPVLAEPSAGARDSANVVPCAELVCGVEEFVSAHRPERVLVVGRPTLSRAIGRLLAGSEVDVVAERGSWPDTARTARRVMHAVPVLVGGTSRVGAPEGSSATARPSRHHLDVGDWLADWLQAGRAAQVMLERELDTRGGLDELAVAAELRAYSPDVLLVGSSKPVRDLLIVGPSPRTRVLANRGVAGIDGTVSTAIGVALTTEPEQLTVALVGDLTFLHDANGLILGPTEPVPDLTLVVVNNDGGAIFGLLEQGADSHGGAFERLFGTPHGVDLAALCAATGTPHERVTDRPALAAALRRRTTGLRVVEVRTDRGEAVDLERAIRAAVNAELMT